MAGHSVEVLHAGQRPVAAAAMICSVLFAGTANAGIISPSNPTDTIVSVTASSGSLSGSINIPLSQAFQLPNGWVWFSTGQNIILDSVTNEPIGSLDSASLFLLDERRVALSFNVTAGNAKTVFSLSSALLAFSPLINPIAQASAGITVTDGNANGGSLIPLGPNGTYYSAMYGDGVNPMSTFANLIDTSMFLNGGGGNVGINGSDSASENYPLNQQTYIQLAGVVTEMRAQYDFSLSAFDQASGTSVFTLIIPGPGSSVLIAIGGLTLLRRRR